MNTTSTCPLCGDSLDLHIGNKRCVGQPDGTPEERATRRAERRATHAREYKRKMDEYYYGSDVTQ